MGGNVNRITALFRTPAGNLAPALIDNEGRLNASVIPITDPFFTFHFMDKRTGSNASINIPGVPGMIRVVTAITAAVADTAVTPIFTINLNDSINGDIWAGVLASTGFVSAALNISRISLPSAAGADLNLSFSDEIVSPTIRESLFIAGVNVFV